jgi:hypothetical protein
VTGPKLSVGCLIPYDPNGSIVSKIGKGSSSCRFYLFCDVIEESKDGFIPNQIFGRTIKISKQMRKPQSFSIQRRNTRESTRLEEVFFTCALYLICSKLLDTPRIAKKPNKTS